MSTTLGRLASVNPPVADFMSDPDEEVTFLPLECVWPDGQADLSRRAVARSVASGYTQFRDGDVLVPKITPTFEAGRVVPVRLGTRLGAGTTELHVLRPNDGVDARFIAYVCRSQPFLQEGASCLQGVGNLRRVPADFIAKFPVAVKDFKAQRTIADFLDRETGLIDNLISEQEVLIGLLRERRRAVVDAVFESNECVDLRVRHLLAAKPIYGVLVPKYVDQSDSDAVPFYRVGNLGMPNLSAADRWISNAQSAEYSRTLLRSGDVLLGVVGRMGAVSVVTDAESGGNVARAVCVLRPKESTPPRLLAYWLSSTAFMVQAAMATSGDSVQPTLGMGDLSSFRVRWPLNAEALDALNVETSSVDSLIANAEQFVSLSKERRTALITAAVTGQIDVRDEVA